MSNTIKEDVFAWAEMGEKEIVEITKNVTEKLKEFKIEVIKIKKEDLSFENYIHRSDFLSAEIGRLAGVLFGYTNLHTDEKIQNMGRKVELEISKVLNEFAYDMEIYQQFVNYYNGNFKKQKKTLTGEQIKIVEDSNKAYKKMGMHLDKKTKKLLLDKNNKINKLAQEFDVECVKNYQKGLWFKKEELAGVSDESLKSFKFDEKKKKFFVNCSGRDDLGTDYPIVKKYCTVAKTREIVTKYNEAGVGDKNNKNLAQILKLRSEVIKILGFKTWGDYSMDDEMMNKPAEVKKFLEDLISKISPSYLKTNLKIEKILKERKEKLSTASYAFGENLLKVNDLPVKEEEYKPYFELENVLKVLFKTWENLFDLEVRKIDKKVFNDDTTSYEFYDKKTNAFLGHGVFDLHPRKWKYGHACVADILKKYKNMENKDVPGFTFLICNFKKSLSGPTYITLSDMNTLYHEAGHMLHMILMKNNYVTTGSTSRDFVEIPSQFHENFISNKKFVEENFKHFETGEKMPKKLLQNISSFSKKGEAKSWVRTSTAALFDQVIHGNNILKFANSYKNIDTLFNKMWNEKIKIPCTKTQSFPSVWGHLVGGYDAKYYSYVISKVYAQDVWQEFAKGGVKKGKMSEKYKKLLEAAGTKNEKEIVKDFLGRKVSLKPFLEILKD
jgi:Zn-dependent oligopeptidase